MVNFHDATHLPWWSTIILTTIIARTVTTLPLSIYQQQILAKVEKISLEMPAIAEELKKETNIAVRKFKWNEQQAKMMYSRSLKKQWNNLIIRDNCHPAKSIVLVLIQVPMWICQSYAIRNLVYGMPDPTVLEAQSIMAELALGGFLWIPNLTDIDHSFIVPVAFGVINLTIIEVRSNISFKIEHFWKCILTFYHCRNCSFKNSAEKLTVPADSRIMRQISSEFWQSSWPSFQRQFHLHSVSTGSRRVYLDLVRTCYCCRLDLEDWWGYQRQNLSLSNLIK